jgi:ATP-binding protein involved in chromosome partitioning
MSGQHRMRIAVPLAQGRLAMHFGHCEQFVLIDVDEEHKGIGHKEIVTAPDHQPGLLPRWLAEKGVQVVIAGGMGRRALGLFGEHGIEVAVGAPADSPENLVSQYLAGTLKTGENVCDH